MANTKSRLLHSHNLFVLLYWSITEASRWSSRVLSCCEENALDRRLKALSADAELGWINSSVLTSEDQCGRTSLWDAHHVNLSFSQVTVTPSAAARYKGSSCARFAIVVSSSMKGKLLNSSSDAAVGFRLCICTGQQRRAALNARTIP